MTETYVRSIISVKVRSADQPKDVVSHTVWHHHSDEAGSLGPFDPAGHATNVLTAFKRGSSANLFQTYLGRQITVRVYNMGDMKPRPVLAEAIWTPSSWETTPLAPRELAVPLRYYADRNLVGQRGRIFIGPWINTLVQELVNDTRNALSLLDLAVGLAAIGGVQMSWCMHSAKQDLLDVPASPGGTTPAAYHDITYAWVNDQWAHQSEREQAEITRYHQAITPGLP